MTKRPEIALLKRGPDAVGVGVDCSLALCEALLEEEDGYAYIRTGTESLHGEEFAIFEWRKIEPVEGEFELLLAVEKSAKHHCFYCSDGMALENTLAELFSYRCRRDNESTNTG